MERRSASASAGVNPAASMAIFIACSWKSGTPRVLPSTARQLRGGEVHRLGAVAAAQIGMHHVALDRPGPDDRDLDDQIVEVLGFSRGSIDICARLSTWKTPIESARLSIA